VWEQRRAGLGVGAFLVLLIIYAMVFAYR